MDVSVVISTYNRCALLGATLDSLAAMRLPPQVAWEVIVADNNSTDATPRAVYERIAGFPAPLRYVFEGRQGKSHGVNAAVALSNARVIAFTDDDVRVDPDWLAAGTEPLVARADIHYTGGPVFPIWEVSPPGWIQGDSGTLRGPLALLDYGPDPFLFEERQRIPVGVNMAVSRAVIDRIGGFHPAMDRRGTSLFGQGQAEFFFRTRAAGLKGLYVPSMRVWHHVPASRMRANHYRHWWFSKGTARAFMEQWHPVSEMGLDLAGVPRILGVPRYMWRSVAEDVAQWVAAILTSDARRRIEREAMLAFAAGYVAGRLRVDRRRRTAPGNRADAPRGECAAAPPASSPTHI